MQPVLGIANLPLAQRPLLQLTPQPLAANPPRGSTQLYTHHCILRGTTATVREQGLERVMVGGGEAAVLLFVSHSSLVPSLLALAGCVSGRG